MRRWFRSRNEERLDQELRYHFDKQVEEYVASGLSPEEARRKARLEFGHLDEVKEECRDIRPFAWLDGLRRDVRFALRLFARSPGFSAVCLVTLALGIGANGAIFSVINQLVLTPPAFPQPDRVIAIQQDARHLHGNPQALFSAPEVPFYAQRRTFRTISDVAIAQLATSELREGEPEDLWSVFVTANFLDVLRVEPLLGRWFSEQDAREHAAYVVLPHSLWARRFGSDSEVVGRSIRLSSFGRELFTVIGVLDANLEGRYPFEDFRLFLLPPEDRSLDERTDPTVTVARLADGFSIEEASAELIARQAAMFPDNNHSNGGKRIVLRTAGAQSIAEVENGLWVVVCAVGLILLIACSNLAALLLTRGMERKHEMAIRRGLGAARRTIVSQTLAEVLLLTLAGGALALLTAWASIRGLQSIRFNNLPDISDAGLNWSVVACCFALALGTALLIGLLPAWRASRVEAMVGLRIHPATPHAGDRRTRDLLVVGQISLSLVLVAGAGLLVRSMVLLLSIDPGFDAENVISLEVASRGHPEEQVAFWREVLAAARTVPGVEAAAAVDYGPPARTYINERYEVVGEPEPPAGTVLHATSRRVSRDYFSVLGIELIAGRGFTKEMQRDGRELVVSRAFAERHWSVDTVLGQRVRLTSRSPDPVVAEIIGVVEDVRQYTRREAPEALFYLQIRHAHELLVKTAGPPRAFADSLKTAVRQVDPTQTFRVVETIAERDSKQNAELRFYMYLLSAFAGLALLLAVVGLYSVAAQAAVRRTQEIGLRMAVGASRIQILLMIARQGLVLAAAGIAVGMAASYALSTYLESWLYEITPTDPLTFAAAAGILALVAWCATVIPAWRAARLDPMKALRYE
ncbi:MAG: ABC transporter permease [Acidobacteria bacterium]|nr:ABC transporter permease [Acidobacteriota bacterium]MDA1236453.1 ABC transporter permease [Acidobacteriota bacterium]